jgi:transcriptional regulator with XRE-family HTH domain
MMLMTNINWYAMSDPAIINELGRQLKTLRLQKNITQEEMAQKTGLNRITIGETEKGRPPSLLTFIQLLRALDKLDLLNEFMSAPAISPIQMAKLQTKTRKRASSINPSPPKKKSTW